MTGSGAGASCRGPARDLVDGRAAILLWAVPAALVVLAPFMPFARAWLWAPSFALMGIACVANARRCGRRHCFVTGPLFLGACAVELGSVLLGVEVPALALGAVVLVGVLGSVVHERTRGTYRHC